MSAIAELRGQTERRHAEDHQDLVQPGDQEEADDETASGAEFAQHVEVRHLGRDALLHRELLA